MKKIDTTNIAGLAKAPFIKATHDHIKESIQESTGNIVKGLLGSYTANDLIVLYGCVVTATIPGTSSITAGAIYYNGEIYEVDANASLITTGAQTLVWGIVTTYIASDSTLTWSDAVIRNLHRIDKLALSAGTSGSGLANYNGATVKSTFTTNWIVVGSGGSAPAFQNSWTNAGSIIDENVVSFAKSTGTVYLRGIVGGGTTSTTMFTLPVGYRPLKDTTCAVYAQVGAAFPAKLFLIEKNGNVSCGGADAAWIDGVTFRID